MHFKRTPAMVAINTTRKSRINILAFLRGGTRGWDVKHTPPLDPSFGIMGFLARLCHSTIIT